MIGKTIGIFFGTVGCGAFAVAAMVRWDAMIASSKSVDINDLKKSFLREGKIEEKHHEVYQKVGEEKWEGEVKPEFIRDVTIQTMWETGKVLPSWQEMTKWVKDHPDEAKRLMDRHAAKPGDVSPPPSR